MEECDEKRVERKSNIYAFERIRARCWLAYTATSFGKYRKERWQVDKASLRARLCSVSSRIRAGVQIYWIQTISIELRLCQEGYERIVIDDFQFEGIAVTRERVGAKSA